MTESYSRKFLSQGLFREYEAQPHTTEFITLAWQLIWTEWGNKADFKISVPPCDYTSEEILQVEARGNMLIFVPSEESIPANYAILYKIFPEAKTRYPQSDPFGESYQPYNIPAVGGWYDIEKSLKSPNLNTTEAQLAKIFKGQNRGGQTLTQYFIGAQFSKLLTGHYFDEGDPTYKSYVMDTSSRLLGSRDYFSTMVASYDRSIGLLFLSTTNEEEHRGLLGGRSYGISNSQRSKLK